MFAILLIVFFAGGSYFDLFPLRGLVSANFDSLPWYQKITDYLWHITLPVLATVIGGFAALTMLTKNSFLDEVRKQYVVTARAKGVSEKNILWKHVFRNAMLLVIAGFPATFISMFFTGSLLIEVMFSQWPWLTGLRSDRLARLSCNVWYLVYFHPDWPAAEYCQ